MSIDQLYLYQVLLLFAAAIRKNTFPLSISFVIIEKQLFNSIFHFSTVAFCARFMNDIWVLMHMRWQLNHTCQPLVGCGKKDFKKLISNIKIGNITNKQRSVKALPQGV